MAKRPLTPSVVPATLVVAAANSLHPERADYRCTGINDHLVIQRALDALPATGGEVKLLDGTYNCQVTINLDTNQTLRGCGRNTILTTSTADLIFLSTVGGAGTEKTGIAISDMQIDGDDTSDCGIYFEYVDYSLIQNVYSRRHAAITFECIYLLNSDFNQIAGNTCQGNGYDGIHLTSSNNNTVTGNTCQGSGRHGIYLDISNNNTVTGNTCQGNSDDGIYLYGSNNNTVTGNTCQGNDDDGIYLDGSSNNNTVTGNTCQGNYNGIYLDDSNNNTVTGNTCQGSGRHGIYLYGSNNNTVTGNTCQGSGRHGIYLYGSNNNTVTGNTCTENSQGANNTYDDIYLVGSDYNNIQCNTCRAGALANKPRYGINISNAACDGNLVTNNDLYNDGFGTGSFNNAGTGTVTAAGNRV